MKPTIIDRIVGWFDPAAGYRRVQARQAQDLIFRAYDGAKSTPTSDWKLARNTSANAEIRPALPVLRDKSRDLVRNSPFALRAVNVVVANTVGDGITAKIKGRNKTQEKKLNDAWLEITETNLCDEEGFNNFAGLQALAMRSTVESGEIIALKKLSPEAPRIRLLESDFIYSAQDSENTIQGIEVDDQNRPILYHLYKRHPGDRFGSAETFDVSADQVMHMFRRERPGQLRGVPWAHAVIETLKDFSDYQYASLVRQKIAACFGGFITTNNRNSMLSDSELKARREAEMQLSPGMVRYLNEGESFQHSSPPGVDGYSDFTRETMRATAAGFGIPYEAMTGDYSQVNFSSARMGYMEFRRNIETWQCQILIAKFCDPYFKLFLEWARVVKGLDTEGVTVEWVAPAHTMVDPGKEISADKEAVKAGFKSRAQVIRENGYEPESVLAEIAEERKQAKDLDVQFDVDYPVMQQNLPLPPDGQGDPNSGQQENN